MTRLPRKVAQHLEKARSAALCAVENYNKPGVAFRTRNYVILMIIAWTAVFHAIFYRRGKKPWYIRSGHGRGVRYEKVDGEPRHWELSECLRQYWGDDNPPERENLLFMLKLRNKIEHRDYPELDPALYGECQAMLMNLEDTLVQEFGEERALAESLGVALQFSALRPSQQAKAIRRLETSAAQDVLDFIETFRSGLRPEVLGSTKFSLKVFLVPKIANRRSAADLAVEFVPFDPERPDEMDELRKVTALIKEKRVPVASSGLMKPGEVVDRLAKALPYQKSNGQLMYIHTQAWKHYGVRPEAGSEKSHATRAEFCVYDELADTYGYTDAWVRYLEDKLTDPIEYRKITRKSPPKEIER